MKKGIALIFGIAFIATRCYQVHFEKEDDAVDSLIAKLETVNLMYQKIDTTGIADLSQKFSENLAFVQHAYINREDTMSQDVALLMSDYRILKKPAKSFSGNYQRASEELQFSKNQLLDLKHDLQNNLLDSNLVQDILQDERSAVSKLENSIQDLKLSSEFTKKKRAELEPRIDSLIQVLKNDQS